MSIKKSQNVIAIALAVLLLGTLLNSGYFFLGILKLSIGKWLAFNACSVAIIIYLLCFVLFRISRKDFLLSVPLLPMYYYGTMGLFVMPWDTANAFAQITHILITINVVWIIYLFLKDKKFESLGKGLLIGILVFVPMIAYIQSFVRIYMDEFLKALQSL